MVYIPTKHFHNVTFWLQLGYVLKVDTEAKDNEQFKYLNYQRKKSDQTDKKLNITKSYILSANKS